MTNKELLKEGYINIKEIPNRGICGLYNFAFTVGLVYNIDKYGYSGRYCYPNLYDAKIALDNWDGIDDPKDKYWLKHKGIDGEWTNKLK